MGIAAGRAIATQTWTRIEFAIDGTQGTLQTRVDGSAVTGLEVDATPTADIDRNWVQRGPWRPALVDFKLGWEQYASTAQTL